jgi:RNA polymerase sigma-70 factor (ECF subfamily)
MGDITRLLARWKEGDARALEELTPIVYQELRQLAGQYMRRESSDHTLQPTALVHEAYVRLTGIREARFQNRAHFYGAAATIMRRVLVDHARERDAAKRGAGATLASLDEAAEHGVDLRFDLIYLSDALDRLAALAPKPARVVELRYFGGLSVEETAEVLDVAPITVKRHWAFARAWLHRTLTAADVPGAARR